MVHVPATEALDKPKGDAKIMLELHAGDILAALPDAPVVIERNGKELSYRRMRRALEDHAGLVADNAVIPTRAPTVAYFCALLGEAEERACLTSLVRIRLTNGDYVVFRPSLTGTGKVALIEGNEKALREVQGLRDVSVQTVGGKPWLFVEQALRHSEHWTTTELMILAPDRSLRTRLTVVLHEVDARSGNRYVGARAVVEDGKLWRRGKTYQLGEDGEPTQLRTLDEALLIPP